jgi:hypothetical protein
MTPAINAYRFIRKAISLLIVVSPYDRAFDGYIANDSPFSATLRYAANADSMRWIASTYPAVEDGSPIVEL